MSFQPHYPPGNYGPPGGPPQQQPQYQQNQGPPSNNAAPGQMKPSMTPYSQPVAPQNGVQQMNGGGLPQQFNQPQYGQPQAHSNGFPNQASPPSQTSQPQGNYQNQQQYPNPGAANGQSNMPSMMAPRPTPPGMGPPPPQQPNQGMPPPAPNAAQNRPQFQSMATSQSPAPGQQQPSGGPPSMGGYPQPNAQNRPMQPPGMSGPPTSQPSQNGSFAPQMPMPGPPGPGAGAIVPQQGPPAVPGMGGPPNTSMPGSFPGGPTSQGGYPSGPNMNGPGTFPGSVPPGPGGPTAPGQPGGFQHQQPAPGGFPSGPGGPGMPGSFPGGPGMPGGFPPGPGGPGFQPGPGGPGGFPPGPGGPGGFPPGPGGPGGYPQGPGGPGMPGAPGFPPNMNNPGMPGPPGSYPGGPGGAPGMPGGYPGQTRQRLDPNMMPSAVAVMEDDAVRAGLFPTGYPHAEPPPFVSTNFYVQDQGNCNPRMMRSTIYAAPANSDMLKTTQVPFAVACSPFAKLHENEIAPPVLDLAPVRCQRCKAYMCPFMEFQDGGRRFRCPFCHASTPVDECYFAHLDHTGRRTDIEHRPELYLGAYEFVATKQYCKNGLPPKEPAFIFMIDVSYNAVQNGMLEVLCRNLERVLHDLPKVSGQSESSIRVGLATFDQAVHFYDLSSPQPSMLVVGDVNEMFVPIVDGLLLPFSQAVNGIRAVLAELPRLFSQNKSTETMLGPVVNAGMDALKCADRAGKLFIFSTSLPTLEAPGKLKAKTERNLLGTDKEKTVLTPQCEFYTKAGEQCVKAGVTVDLFLFPNSYIDVATISQLSAVTGGAVYKYQYFMPQKDANRFLSDLRHDVARQIGFDCMVRVRSSAGIRPVSFSGSFYMENTTDLEMASLDEDKAFFAELKHDDKLTDPSAIIQCAVLYTAVSGQRRLRILNLCLPVTSDYNVLFRVADSDTLTTYLLKTAVQTNRDKGNKEMRDSLAQRTAQILASYREKCSESAPLGQLILPEQLKLMPLYVNSIIKNDSVSGGAEMTIDDKAWMIELIRALPVADAMRLLYPRVYPVSQLETADSSELTSLPPAVRSSMEYLTNDKAFIIDNGIVLFLWIGLGVPEIWVQEVFGANSVTQMDAESHVIPERDNTRSRGLRRAIQLLEPGTRERKLFIIREKDALEPWMKKFLVEDKSGPNSMSYVDFLCHVHREIRNIIS